MTRLHVLVFLSALAAIAVGSPSAAAVPGGVNNCRNVPGDGGPVAKSVKTHGGMNCMAADDLIAAYIESHGDDGPGQYGDCTARPKRGHSERRLRVRCDYDSGESLSFVYIPGNRP